MILKLCYNAAKAHVIVVVVPGNKSERVREC